METFKDLRESRKDISELTREEKLALLDFAIDHTEPVAWKENGKWVVKKGEEWMYEPY